jgi:hypothetical protein
MGQHPAVPEIEERWLRRRRHCAITSGNSHVHLVLERELADLHGGAVVANRNRPQKHVWRASIILLTADGLDTNAIMRGSGRSKSVVWRWQDRFMQEGVAGLLRDKTRPPGKKPLDAGVIEQVITLPYRA